MISIPERLALIAKEIEEGSVVADIGTDHGLLPAYLIESGRARKVIMTDISCDSLNKAKTLADEMGFSSDIAESRVGDGLECLDKCEADVVVMAGIGGELIRDILDWEFYKTVTFSEYILQPRNKAGLLRAWLTSKRMDIVKDLLVRENGRICEIIKVRTDGPRSGSFQEPLNLQYDRLSDEEKAAFDYPYDLESYEEGLTTEYLAKELEKAEQILCKMKSEAKDPKEKVSFMAARAKRIGKLLEDI